jgi:rod shape determining protein RodA
VTVREVDRSLLLAVTLVTIPGLATLYSAGQADFPTVASGIWMRQVLWLILGGLGAAFAFRFSPRVVEWITPYAFVTAIILLVATLFFGTGAGTAAGSKSWLSIGSIRIGQPAEFAKLATALMLARHLGAKRESPRTLAELIPAGAIVFVPFVLIGLQPDLGSALVLVGILFAMLYWVGVNVWLLLLLASPMISLFLAFSTGLWGAWIVAITLLLFWLRPYVTEALVVWSGNVAMGVIALGVWNRLADYQKNRILSFLNPEVDPQAAGWNVIQSKVAIGSGGVFGTGFLEGSQKRLAFLPAQHTDFIFSIVGEEFGFLGVAVSLLLFAFLLFVLLRIAATAVDSFSSLMVAGITGMLFVHIVENVGMTIGMLPVTGIPLPFFSYGGSFALICLFSIGLVLRTAWETRYGGYAEG